MFSLKRLDHQNSLNSRNFTSVVRLFEFVHNQLVFILLKFSEPKNHQFQFCHQTQEIIARLQTLMDFCKEDLEERKFCNGKKNFPLRGAFEERKFCKSFLEGRILQEELWNKQFREKLQRILQEGGFGRRFKNFAKKKKVA